jgi:hypothetical protein
VSARGIAAPAPQINVTVLGLVADYVRVLDVRHARSARDVVRVELGDVVLIGDLHHLQLVAAEVARGLVQIEDARRDGTIR